LRRSSDVLQQPGHNALDRHGADLASEIRKLRERLHPDAPPIAPSRNLFEFHHENAGGNAAVRPVPLPPSESSERAHAAPPLKLIGLAEADAADAGDQGSARSRTAILSGFGDVFLVTENDTVASRYRVSKVDSGAVELVDTITGASFQLTLQ
jgi:hypothetical protein